MCPSLHERAAYLFTYLFYVKIYLNFNFYFLQKLCQIMWRELQRIYTVIFFSLLSSVEKHPFYF